MELGGGKGGEVGMFQLTVEFSTLFCQKLLTRFLQILKFCFKSHAHLQLKSSQIDIPVELLF